MTAEKVERLRQYLAGRSEIAAGDTLVIRDLHDKARERQRWMLGLPMFLMGAGVFYALTARRRKRLSSRP
jgi:hypothetical protein